MKIWHKVYTLGDLVSVCYFLYHSVNNLEQPNADGNFLYKCIMAASMVTSVINAVNIFVFKYVGYRSHVVLNTHTVSGGKQTVCCSPMASELAIQSTKQLKDVLGGTSPTDDRQESSTSGVSRRKRHRSKPKNKGSKQFDIEKESEVSPLIGNRFGPLSNLRGDDLLQPSQSCLKSRKTNPRKSAQ